MIKAIKKMLPQKLKDKIRFLFLDENQRRNEARERQRKNEREKLANRYLQGHGIEIGALHNPLKVGRSANVKYVDRLSNEDLRKHYSDLSHLAFVSVDIIDQGELLEKIENESQDFVIANHFVEHCQNPILTLMNMFRVLKNKGILYITLPDKRFTFDCNRPVTPFEHLLQDYEQGPEGSKKEHFEEWVRVVHQVQDPIRIKQESEELMKRDYSIHFHVWTQIEMVEMFLQLRKQFNIHFDIETCLNNDSEFILLLRKLK